MCDWFGHTDVNHLNVTNNFYIYECYTRFSTLQHGVWLLFTFFFFFAPSPPPPV